MPIKRKNRYIITKKFLIQEYVINNKSQKIIAKSVGCSKGTIKRRLLEYYIVIRTKSQSAMLWRPEKKKYFCIDCGKKISPPPAKRCGSCATSGKNNPVFGCKRDLRGKLNPNFGKGDKIKGSNNPNWQGGKTSLSFLIRNSKEYKYWRIEIFKRDNYTCQECGKLGGHLEAHHRKPFVEMLNQFLKIYDQFSPLEDKETLIRFAMKYESFWDTENGKTLCKDCHKLTDNYLKNSYVIKQVKSKKEKK